MQTSDHDDDLREQAQGRARAEAERLRRQLGLSYRDLAEKSGVGQTTIHRLLRTDKWVRFRQLAAISDALGIGPAGLAAIESQAFQELVRARRAEERSSLTPEGMRIAVDLEHGSMDGFTPSEIQEVILGAKKGAVVAINEIHARRRPFRGVGVAAAA